MKRIIVSMVALACILGLSVTGLGASTTYQSVSVGGKKANVIWLDTNGLEANIVTAGGSINSDTTAQSLVDTEGTAFAAINGGFFNAYYKGKNPMAFPDNCPIIYSSIVKDGKIIVGGGNTNAMGFAKDGSVTFDRVSLSSSISFNGGSGIYIWDTNTYNKNAEAVMLFTPQLTLPVTLAPTSKAVIITDGVVTQIVDGGTHSIGQGQMILAFNEGAVTSHVGWKVFPKIGDKADYIGKYVANSGQDWSGYPTILGGGLLLVKDGVNVSEIADYNAGVWADNKQSPTSVLQRSFIGLAQDGRLVLGTVTGSFKEIANTLIGMGVTQAMSLDGGASSMLYTQANGFITPAGRKLASALVFSKINHVKNSSQVMVNGVAVDFEAYTIKQSNYFKLRDIGMALKNTDKSFEIKWNATNNAIEIVRNTAYTPVGGELAKGAGDVAEAGHNRAKLYLDGQIGDMLSYTIGQNNYFKLRDLGKAMDFYVGWDGAAGVITIDTTRAYE